MKKILLIILIIFFTFISTAICFAEKTYLELKDTVFRLHIIANSDSSYDQKIKLKVRDNILKYISNQNFVSKSEAIEYLRLNLNEINNIVDSTLKENKYNYDYSSNITCSFFPTKYYSNISLPAGEYDCLKISLGNASGQNWWCILYPNLCSNDIAVSTNANNSFKNLIDNETYSMITNDVSYKFKIVEIVENFKNKIKL